MRGKSSSSKLKSGILETESKLENLSEPHLSGAYIRSLVKQLSSSRTKDSLSKGLENLEGQVNQNLSSSENMACDGFSDHGNEEGKKTNHHQPPPQQHKKQVRRRLHTSRPYQERLLNMAEARREIVTALKFHRAAMKKAREQQQQQQEQEDQKPNSGHVIQPFQPTPDPISMEHDAKSTKSRRNPRIYASNSSISNEFPTTYTDNYVSYSPGVYAPYSWSTLPIPPPPPLIQENLNFTLPSQTLGLNLNLQDFNNLDASAFNRSTNPSSIYSSSSSASTSSSPISAYAEEIQCTGAQATIVPEFENPGLHHAIDDKEMAELRSIGEQYQMEWDDTMNLVHSAWWFKFLKAMEVESVDNIRGDDDLVTNLPFDEVMEFPAWLNTSDESCVNDVCCCSQDPTLPCMDIEEIEGMDGDWLA